jgi:ribosomal protein S18 acetylase RimI-like enzyme
MYTLEKITDPHILAALNKPLHELHVQQHPHLFKPYNEAAVAAYFADCLSDNTYLHIGAFVQGVPAGFVQLQVLERPANAFVYSYSYIHVHQLSVPEAFRGRGIATALMDAAQAHAAEQGIALIDLTVWQFNETAQSFYRSIGYDYSLLRMYKRSSQ